MVWDLCSLIFYINLISSAIANLIYQKTNRVGAKDAKRLGAKDAKEEGKKKKKVIL